VRRLVFGIVSTALTPSLNVTDSTAATKRVRSSVAMISTAWRWRRARRRLHLRMTFCCCFSGSRSQGLSSARSWRIAAA
jgi:hypothetical protein